jgi:hypothetical protein
LEKSAKILIPLLSSSATATAAKHLFTLNESAAEFYVNSAVAERFFAPLWESSLRRGVGANAANFPIANGSSWGVRRVLIPRASERAFLQQFLANGWAAPK